MAHKLLRGRKPVQKADGVRQTIRKSAKARNQRSAAKKKKQAEKAALEAKGISTEITPASLAKPGPQGHQLSNKMKKQLRAEADAQRQHTALYPNARTLLVGEGNFSFARALCRVLKSGANVFATAYDGEALLNKKYSDCKEIRAEIEGQLGGTTLFSVDGTRLHKIREFRRAFHTVSFNFPHLGSGEADVEKSVIAHRKLLAGFFKSAYKCLNKDQDAQIIVALKSGEPYKSWKIVQTARLAVPEMELRSVVIFCPSAWPGYEHRRTHGFDDRLSKKDSEELQKGAKVYVFRRSQEMLQEEEEEED